MKATSSKLRVGDWVEVRSKEEISRTLDSDGRLDGMPFMPEMLAFCGKKFQVYKRAHKTCDTVFPVRGRRVSQTVHLDARCDGSAHGGCQASCLLFWKDAWLKPISPGAAGGASRPEPRPSATNDPLRIPQCSESSLFAATHRMDADSGQPLYSCQATQLPYATEALEWWEIGQYVEDYTSGNVGLGRILSGAIYSFFHWLSWTGIGLGRPIRWFYDTFYPLWRGTPYPRRVGTIPEGEPTPAAKLDLQPGELVRIKPFPEILKTLSVRNLNRGLYFDAEEVPYCGKTYRVLKRVTRILDEKTGRMQEMKTAGIILDSVVCQSRYSKCRMFCPRSIYPYWREIWLERVEPVPSSAVEESARQVPAPCQPASSSR